MSTEVLATPRVSRRAKGDPARTGVLMASGLSLLTVAGSFVGAASLIQYTFPLVAVGAGAALLFARRWQAYVAFTLILWFVAPELRRIVDYKSAYVDLSLVNVTPALVSVIALPWAIYGTRRLTRDVASLFVVAGAVMVYGFVVGALRNPHGAVADIPLIAAPLAFGYFVLTVPKHDQRLRALVANIAAWTVLLAGAYGIIQYFLLPAWDQAWMIDSGASNLGTAEAREFRIFSTFTTTGPLGQVLAALLLLLAAERRSALRWTASIVGVIVLGLTLVRAGWIGLAVGIVAMLLMGRTNILRTVAVAGAAVVLLGSLYSPVVDSTLARINDTTSAGSSDQSLTTRLAFQEIEAPILLRNPIGVGMGATGRATATSGGVVDPRVASFDSGIFESIARYGSVAGSVLVLVLVGATISVCRRARRGTLFDACCAAGIVALVVGMVFTDTTRGVYGVVLWTLFALAGRRGQPAPVSPGGAHDSSTREVGDQVGGRVLGADETDPFG